MLKLIISSVFSFFHIRNFDVITSFFRDAKIVFYRLACPQPSNECISSFFFNVFVCLTIFLGILFDLFFFTQHLTFFPYVYEFFTSLPCVPVLLSYSHVGLCLLYVYILYLIGVSLLFSCNLFPTLLISSSFLLCNRLLHRLFLLFFFVVFIGFFIFFYLSPTVLLVTGSFKSAVIGFFILFILLHFISFIYPKIFSFFFYCVDFIDTITVDPLFLMYRCFSFSFLFYFGSILVECLYVFEVTLLHMCFTFDLLPVINVTTVPKHEPVYDHQATSMGRTFYATADQATFVQAANLMEDAILASNAPMPTKAWSTVLIETSKAANLMNNPRKYD